MTETEIILVNSCLYINNAWNIILCSRHCLFNILSFQGILDIFIVLGNYNKIGARIGTTATTITPTMTTAILPIDSSVSPNSLAAATPKVCPLVPSASPLAIGLDILNNLTILAPKAEMTTAF